MDKRIKTWSFRSVLGLTLLSIVGCSDRIDGSEYSEGDNNLSKPVYFAISIRDVSARNSATRADRFDSDNDDYKPGTKDYIFNKGLDLERAIYAKDEYLDSDEEGFTRFLDTPHRALIFDKGGRKIGELFLKSIITKDSPDENPLEYDSYTILYTSMPEENMLEIQADVDKILVVLNASNKILEDLDALGNYNSIKKLLDDSSNVMYFEENGTKYFTMSSSIVVKEGDVIPFTDGIFKYYETREDAIKNAGNMQMYVERVHSKYTLLFQQGDKFYYFDPEESAIGLNGTYTPVDKLILTSGTDFNPEHEKLRYVREYSRDESLNQPVEPEVKEGNWKVNFTGWSLNAVEKKEYLFKNLSSGSQYFSDWHSLAYRNFWAEDMSYNIFTFPDQYREAEDVKNVNYFNPAESDNYPLDYYPYSQLNKKLIHQYSPESTFDVSIFTAEKKYEDVNAAYKDMAHMRAGTHLIITAQLLIEGFDETSYLAESFDENGLVTGVNDKYYMNGIYWAPKAYKEYVIDHLAFWMRSDANQKLEKFGPNDGIFYRDNRGNKAQIEDFEIVKANIKGGDGMVWVRPTPETKLYVKNPDDENDIFTEVTSKFDVLAKEHKEYFARHYNEGRMYYPVPVRHNIKGNNILEKTGDFGSVRNHWYYFTVEKIMSPGASVDDPDQPIVPNPDPTISGIGVNIKVLDWNKIEISIENILEQNHPSDHKD